MAGPDNPRTLHGAEPVLPLWFQTNLVPDERENEIWRSSMGEYTEGPREGQVREEIQCGSSTR